ncbi:hypothetical protein TMatcc_006673 [Talaromyces marneffei ATCC 18224]
MYISSSILALTKALTASNPFISRPKRAHIDMSVLKDLAARVAAHIPTYNPESAFLGPPIEALLSKNPLDHGCQDDLSRPSGIGDLKGETPHLDESLEPAEDRGPGRTEVVVLPGPVLKAVLQGLSLSRHRVKTVSTVLVGAPATPSLLFLSETALPASRKCLPRVL